VKAGGIHSQPYKP